MASSAFSRLQLFGAAPAAPAAQQRQRPAAAPPATAAAARAGRRRGGPEGARSATSGILAGSVTASQRRRSATQGAAVAELQVVVALDAAQGQILGGERLADSNTAGCSHGRPDAADSGASGLEEEQQQQALLQWPALLPASTASSSVEQEAGGAAHLSSRSCDVAQREQQQPSSSGAAAPVELTATTSTPAPASKVPEPHAGAQGPAATADDSHTACAAPKLLALALLSATYLHQAATSYSVPTMQPLISASLHLTDLQAALLNSGHSYVYALALVPAGLLADRVASRPRLLGAGVALWSALGLWGAGASGFGGLAAARLGMAVAHSAQNVVCFGVIPDLFPRAKSSALAVYNSAIYLGRGAMFAVVTAAQATHAPPTTTTPLDALAAPLDTASDLLPALSTVGAATVGAATSAVGGALAAAAAAAAAAASDPALSDAAAPVAEALSGALAAAAAVVDPAAAAGDAAAAVAAADGVWRCVLHGVSLPGALLAAALMVAVADPREGSRAQQLGAAPPPAPSSPAAALRRLLASFPRPGAAAAAAGGEALPGACGEATAATAGCSGGGGEVAATAAGSGGAGEGGAPPSRPGGEVIRELFASGPFVAVTAAAALNDVASYAMIAWQSTFYERVYGLGVDEYAPVLATLLPLTGIVGGVGGGMLADHLTRSGRRWWVTVATSLLSAPLLWASVTAPTPDLSFLYLGMGFALSEAWRAPAAVMARSVVPSSEASTATSVYLCLRNVLGALGPLLVAQLAGSWGLQTALELLLPTMYLASGLLFSHAEHLLATPPASTISSSAPSVSPLNASPATAPASPSAATTGGGVWSGGGWPPALRWLAQHAQRGLRLPRHALAAHVAATPAPLAAAATPAMPSAAAAAGVAAAVAAPVQAAAGVVAAAQELLLGAQQAQQEGEAAAAVHGGPCGGWVSGSGGVSEGGSVPVPGALVQAWAARAQPE